MGDSLTTALLILHSLLAVALLGAITHQAIAVRGGTDNGKKTFGSLYRAVDAAAYSVAIVVLFATASLIGSCSIHPIE